MSEITKNQRTQLKERMRKIIDGSNDAVTEVWHKYVKLAVGDQVVVVSVPTMPEEIESDVFHVFDEYIVRAESRRRTSTTDKYIKQKVDIYSIVEDDNVLGSRYEQSQTILSSMGLGVEPVALPGTEQKVYRNMTELDLKYLENILDTIEDFTEGAES